MRSRRMFLNKHDKDAAWEIVSFVKSLDHPHQRYGGRSYAQHGDDMAILNVFGCLRIQSPSYLDVGSHHPYELSNTALLYQRGCRGINVEANPALFGAFERLRPEDINVCVAVGPQAGEAKFYRVSETCGLNSLLHIPHAADTITVPMITLNDVIEQYANGQWPDLLSIDIEGMDLEVLRSTNLRNHGPKVICVEAVSLHGDISADLRKVLGGYGYAVHSWCGGNLLFVRSNMMDWCR